MKLIAKILIACALLSSASLAPSRAAAETRIPAHSHFIPRLGAGISLEPSGLSPGGVVIHYIYPTSPLRRMWSPDVGHFFADPGDTIIAANGVAIRDAFQLERIVAGLHGRMSISILDARTGAIYSGYVTIP